MKPVVRAAAVALTLASVGLVVARCGANASNRERVATTEKPPTLVKPDSTWRALLSPKEYAVLVDGDTERAFSGEFWNNHERGVYVCAASGVPLFSSEDKFDSGTGWPSFTRPIDTAAIVLVPDNSFGMHRSEVRDAATGFHLGHVFDDGPAPTGKRYCINSGALRFVPAAP